MEVDKIKLLGPDNLSHERERMNHSLIMKFIEQDRGNSLRQNSMKICDPFNQWSFTVVPYTVSGDKLYFISKSDVSSYKHTITVCQFKNVNFLVFKRDPKVEWENWTNIFLLCSTCFRVCSFASSSGFCSLSHIHEQLHHLNLL